MTTETVQPAKPAGDLQPGDHILIEDLDPDAAGVGRVLYAKLFGPAGVQDVSVLVDVGATHEPEQYRVSPAMTVRLAGEAEVATAREAADRLKLGDDLREFASLVSTGAIPVRRGRLQINQQLEDVAALAAVAAALGVEVVGGQDLFRSVDWPKGHEAYDPGLHVTWYAYAEKEPEPAPGVTCEDLADETPTHYETRGWKGDTPGSCGVECACGLGYDGFNSLAEAHQLLAVHIAASQPESAPVHLTFLLGDTACGILPEQIPAADGQTVHAEVVTCPACREVLAPATS